MIFWRDSDINGNRALMEYNNVSFSIVLAEILCIHPTIQVSRHTRAHTHFFKYTPVTRTLYVTIVDKKNPC